MTDDPRIGTLRSINASRLSSSSIENVGILATTTAISVLLVVVLVVVVLLWDPDS